MLVYVKMPSVDACLYVMTVTQTVLHPCNTWYLISLKRTLILTSFSCQKKLDFKCQHHKNYSLRDWHLTLDLISTLACVQKPSISKMSHRTQKKEFLCKSFKQVFDRNFVPQLIATFKYDNLSLNKLPSDSEICQHYVIADTRIISHFWTFHHALRDPPGLYLF